MIIRYRSITGYKYRLIEDTSVVTDLTGHAIQTAHLKLNIDGILTVLSGYCWDGPSGFFTIDTKNFRRGSLFHDAMYQLIRMRSLPVHCKVDADQLLKEICLEDGMSQFRAWYVHKAVMVFGHGACAPGTQKERPVLEAP